MGLLIDFHVSDDSLVCYSRDRDTSDAAWNELEGLVNDYVAAKKASVLVVRVDGFFATLSGLGRLARRFNEHLAFGNRLSPMVSKLSAEMLRLKSIQAGNLEPLDAESIQASLTALGFTRTLRQFQLRNLGSLIALPHGGDFSVPGAGKTTVAYALHTLLKACGTVEQLLVVAPLSAFSAWKDEAKGCFSNPLSVLPYQDGPPPNTDVLLLNYHRLASRYDSIIHWVRSKKTHVILDEAHRVKRGRAGVHGTAALDLAVYAARRDILTGTPAPQSIADLEPLFDFLWPGQATTLLPEEAFVPDPPSTIAEEIHRRISHLYVRTTKKELDLPKTQFRVHKVSLGPIQSAIYQALLGQFRGELALSSYDRRRMREFGRTTMYLLEAATDPALLLAGSSDDDLGEFRHPPLPVDPVSDLGALFRRYRDYETPPKIARCVQIARAVANHDKVLVWTGFRRNIDTLLRLLSDLNPAVVHGGVPPEDGASPNALRIREREIERFHHDDACRVLIANPAACAEGVSLHRACHHAIFLDRTFNAGQFLQAQDRIHRIGLRKEQKTVFSLLLSQGTIDEVVDTRLKMKVRTLSRILSDRDLQQLALPSEEDVVDGLDDIDQAALMEHISGK